MFLNVDLKSFEMAPSVYGIISISASLKFVQTSKCIKR